MLLQQPWRVSGREATATGATRRACAGVVLAAAALLLLLLQGDEASTDGDIIVASEEAKGEGREREAEKKGGGEEVLNALALSRNEKDFFFHFRSHSSIEHESEGRRATSLPDASSTS